MTKNQKKAVTPLRPLVGTPFVIAANLFAVFVFLLGPVTEYLERPVIVTDSVVQIAWTIA